MPDQNILLYVPVMSSRFKIRGSYTELGSPERAMSFPKKPHLRNLGGALKYFNTILNNKFFIASVFFSVKLYFRV